jgi:hypothetical protein
MNLLPKKKIVVLGMISKHRVAGMAWITLHYLIGLQRLGYDVYYVEPQGGSPHDKSVRAAAWIAGIMRRFDMGDRWAFHAVYGDGRCYGLSELVLKELYRSAALIINLHGASQPLPEIAATGRLVYLETDPVELEIRIYNNDRTATEMLSAHCAFFTWGENYGRPDCKVPLPLGFHFKPTRQPVVLDLWRGSGSSVSQAFTTIGNWRQLIRQVEFQGEVYSWSKHYEFLKFIDLPAKTRQPFELALNRYNDAEKAMLESKGWKVVPAGSFSRDIDSYQEYIKRSRGEFTVAKDQNVRLRSGWFSDRSATYLATGRPVINQETGFSNILPTGSGLFAFSTIEEIVQAVDKINSDYEGHRQGALNIAREYFSYDVVLPQLLAEVPL